MNQAAQRTQPALDPNPAALFHVYSAILMCVSGTLYRAITGSLLPRTRRSGGRSPGDQLHSLATHLSFINDLLMDHSALINTTSAAGLAIYPVGVHTLFLSANQVDRYISIRDGLVNAAPMIIRECAGLYQLTISQPVMPMVESELKIIQAATRGVFAMNTFGEAAEILRTGFASTLYVFDLILPENNHPSKEVR